MRITTSLMHLNRYGELLCVLDVESDKAEPWGPDRVRRTVVGNVRERGTAWDEFMRVWRTPFFAVETDSPVFFANGLQLDWDYYGFGSLLRVEGDKLTIQVTEEFDSDLGTFAATVEKRNRERQAEYDRFMNPKTVTRNMIREALGLPAKEGEFFNAPLPPEAINQLQKQAEHRLRLIRNTIV